MSRRLKGLFEPSLLGWSPKSGRGEEVYVGLDIQEASPQPLPAPTEPLRRSP